MNNINMNMKGYIVIICTMPDNENITISLARLLIIKKLAACVTLFPKVRSIYSWNNQLEEQKEIQLFIKTHIKLEQTVFQYIKDKHPYQTPELLTLKVINGESNYLSWIHNTLYTKES